MSILLGVFSVVTLLGAGMLMDKKKISKFQIVGITAAYLIVNVAAYALILPR